MDDPAQSPASHFYVHPSENPAAILVTPPLTGSNYHSEVNAAIHDFEEQAQVSQWKLAQP